jgi:ADP-ribose pyrophosphatase
MGFKELSSERLFNGKLLKVWKESVELPNGRQVSLEVIHHPGSVAILPIDDQGQIWFTHQYRHPIRQMLLELPAGTLEKGEQPEDCARREIQEEIGMAAKHMEAIGAIYLVPGYSDEQMHVYLATGLTPSKLESDYGEYIEIKTLFVREVYTLLESGELFDSKTAAALGMARDRLKAWL